MSYMVSRNGATYGPYSLSELQRYLASGNVLPTDQVRSETDGVTADWTTVAQLLSAQTTPPPSSLYAPAAPSFGGYAPASYAVPTGSAFPDPPKLHWGLVLLFGVLTCGLFIYIWEIVQAMWMRKVHPQSKALFYYLGGDVCFVLYVVFTGLKTANGSIDSQSTAAGFASVFYLGLAVLNLIARFSLRRSLEEHFDGADPVGLQLSGVMTFFFGLFYFQYHLTRIGELKRFGRSY